MCCLLLLLTPDHLLLLGIVDGNILEGKLFTVQHMVKGAQHLQNAFHRHTDDAFHAGDKVLPVVRRHVCPEGQLPQLLIAFLGLPRGADDDACAAGIDDAVVVEVPGGHIAHMGLHGKNFVLIHQHGVPGQADLRIVKGQLPAFKDADGDAGKVADGGAKIAKINGSHIDSSVWILLYYNGYKNARKAAFCCAILPL